MQTSTIRYQLPRKAIKGDCPDCGPKHRWTLSRYIDTKTNEPLPEIYGRCDRESNCGYHLSPYHKNLFGRSYASDVYDSWMDKKHPAYHKHLYINHNRSYIRPSNRTLPIPVRLADLTESALVCAIPDEVFNQSLSHYEQNQFACLLNQHFGPTVAKDLLKRFHIGTSRYWPGACIFWYIDEQSRKRGGQIKLFDSTFHTVKYVNLNGKRQTKTSWVHYAYKRRCDELKQDYPTWLTAYLDEHNNVQKSPCLFGLPQLLTMPVDQPIAIVESPKTAVVCTPYFPQFIWLATGSLSYLNAERLTPLKERNVILFPDLSKDGNAFARWKRIADEVQLQGFKITVSDYLERWTTDAQKAMGLDLADFILNESVIKTTNAEPLSRSDKSQLEQPVINRFSKYSAKYPLNSLLAKPKTSSIEFHKFQQYHPSFRKLGLASLSPNTKK